MSALARVALALDEPVRAARLLSAAERLGESIGLAWQTDEADQRDATIARLRASLGSAYEKTWADATLVSVEDVIADESERLTPHA